MAAAKDSDGFLVLKARIEPVTEAERKRMPAGGLSIEDEAYVPLAAEASIATPSPSTKQVHATPVAPPSQPRVAAYDAIAKGKWVPRFDVPAHVNGPAGTLKDGVVAARDFIVDRAEKPVFFRDGIVRAKIEGSGSVHLRSTGDSYQLALMADGLHLYKWQNDEPIKLATVSPEMLTKRAGFHELTLVAVGSHLVGYLDGKRTIELMDHSITHEGVVAIHAHQSSVKFKDIEVMSLDGVDVKDLLGGLAVLDKLVGVWNLEHTARPSQKNPEHSVTSGKIASRWVLGGRYLRSDYELAVGPDRSFSRPTTHCATSTRHGSSRRLGGWSICRGNGTPPTKRSVAAYSTTRPGQPSATTTCCTPSDRSPARCWSPIRTAARFSTSPTVCFARAKLIPLGAGQNSRRSRRRPATA